MKAPAWLRRVDAFFNEGEEGTRHTAGFLVFMMPVVIMGTVIVVCLLDPSRGKPHGAPPAAAASTTESLLRIEFKVEFHGGRSACPPHLSVGRMEAPRLGGERVSVVVRRCARGGVSPDLNRDGRETQ